MMVNAWGQVIRHVASSWGSLAFLACGTFPDFHPISLTSQQPSFLF